MKRLISNTALIADKSRQFLVYAGILLRRLGYQVYLAGNGPEAVSLARELKPDIVLLDHTLPPTDGASCLGIIRNDNELSRIPVLIIASYVDESVIGQYEKLGCCGLLRKPVNIPEFYSAILGCRRNEEARKTIRVSLSLKVSVNCRDKSLDLYALTLSAEGMFLRTIDPFDAGMEMKLVFSIDDRDPVELKGTVRYVNQLTRELEHEPGMGIKFLDISEDVRCRISCFIIKQLAEDFILEPGDINEEA
ncbi:MAG: response regulator [Nitrospirota bacterium]|nr:response regulator [Nitrospirota bacterium]